MTNFIPIFPLGIVVYPGEQLNLHIYEPRYKQLVNELTPANGFNYYWDDTAKAPYLYNPIEKLFVTHDDKRSVQAKTQYVIDKKLNGIMFWQLTGDAYQDGLLDAINVAKNGKAGN